MPVLPSERQRGITLEYYTKEECKAALRSVSAAIDESEETLVSDARLESMLAEFFSAIRFGYGKCEILQGKRRQPHPYNATDVIADIDAGLDGMPEGE